MMTHEELFKAATDFIEHGGELPDGVAEDPAAIFLSAILRDMHGCVKDNTTMGTLNDGRITKIEDKLGNAWKYILGTISFMGLVVGILARIGVFG